MYKILIADDEPLMRFALKSFEKWENHGFSLCFEASNGEEALKLLAANKIDVVLTDIKMPVMGGIELLKHLHNKKSSPPVIVLSAYDDFQSVRDAFKLGAVDYIVKTQMDTKSLIEILNAAVQMDKRKEKNASNETQAVRLPNLSNISFTLSNAVKYIDEHYFEGINLSKVSNHCEISEGHLSKMFSKELNMAFVEFVNLVRVLKAEELLKTTNMKIYQVAEFTGFNSAEHFCRVFKKITEKSPNSYKNE